MRFSGIVSPCLYPDFSILYLFYSFSGGCFAEWFELSPKGATVSGRVFSCDLPAYEDAYVKHLWSNRCVFKPWSGMPAAERIFHFKRKPLLDAFALIFKTPAA
jgi:hypothetical protein